MLLKKSIFLVILLNVLVLFFSCRKKPVSCFNPSSTLINVDDVVTFKNCSSDFDRVEWDFGDGGSATIKEPSHKYEKKGFYNATLTTFKGKKKSNKITKRIICGYDATFKYDLKFSNWDFENNSRIYGYLSVYRSDDLTNPISQFNSYIMLFDEDSNSDKETFSITLYLPDDYSEYTVKMVFEGSTEEDALVNTGISAITGPSNPTGSAQLNLVNVSYTLSPITYK